MSTIMPLYEIVYHEIVTEIYVGGLTFGDYLPNLKRLEEQYQVGRNTMRRSLQLLIENGFIQMTKEKRYQVIFDMNNPQYLERYYYEMAQRRDAMQDVFYNLILLMPKLAEFSIRNGGAEGKREIIDSLDRVNTVDFTNGLECFAVLNRIYQNALGKAKNPLVLSLFEALFYFIRIPYEKGRKGSYVMKMVAPIIHMYLRRFKQALLQDDYLFLSDQIIHFCNLLNKTVSRHIDEFEMNIPPDQQYAFVWHPMQQREYSYELLIAAILRRVGTFYEFGQELPSYQELADIYSVSLKTSRKAIAVLSQMGIVHTANGRKAVLADHFEKVESMLTYDDTLRNKIINFFDALHLLYITSEPPAAAAMKELENRNAVFVIHPQHPYVPYLIADVFDFIYGLIPSPAFQNIYQELKVLLSWGSLLDMVQRSRKSVLKQSAESVVDAIHKNPALVSNAFQKLLSDVYHELEACAKVYEINVPHKIV
ncbi:GntR family transcriptional regulator [Clostridiaceae bacterium DONG20-135]|uniref:GntR family transcriptional regulator n=1 Tax=Copranaerobaculum intestinale TaxID=2692629 RepID=A0A6N8U6E7_9FIRM|nr:GntR family transcriptional regulator [Copranaerobaculum intestinale]MXQ73471.1 GntR family transcriptional regulator [Copranaerobaculum intestinale]